MLRSLKHYWRIHLAVIAAAAVATAVLAGAVIVGDSMRASLRQLTLDRLGRIDWALTSGEPFGSRLADDLAASLTERGFQVNVAPALMLQAAAIHAESRALAGGVTLIGIDEQFAAMYETSAEVLDEGLDRQPGQIFPSVVLSRSLARELGAEPGEDILLSFEAAREIPRESLLGRQPGERSLLGSRVTVSTVIADRGPGRFALTPHQQSTHNAFVAIEELQRGLDRPGEANALFVGAMPAGPELSAADLASGFSDSLRLEDLGLEIVRTGDWLRLSNRRFVLRDRTVEQALTLLDDAGLQAAPILGYLANELRIGDSRVPYSVIIGQDVGDDTGPPGLVDSDGRPFTAPGDGQVVLSRWTADELGAAVGDRLQVTYYAVGANDDLTTRTAELEVSGIAAMAGVMTDRHILPDFPGIAEADDIASWEPPFPMDLGLIRPADEEFWDLYGAAPKALVNLATAQRLWSNRFGGVTMVRARGTADDGEAFESALRASLDPAAFGLSFEPVKAQGLAAASGATDFAGLFIGFSLFLIVSAALVVGLLFSLSVDLRGKEIGLRRALGFRPASVRRRFLQEGMLLALLGVAGGALLAIAYAALLIDLLARLWRPMLDLPLLLLDLRPASLVGASAGSLLLVALTIVLGLHRLKKVPTPRLLAGVTRPIPTEGRRSVGARISVVSLLLAVASIVGAMALDVGGSPALFFVAGTLLLVSGFAAFSHWCHQPRANLTGARPGLPSYLRMVARNSAYSPGRSLLSVALVGCATFMLVSVAANRRELRPETLGRDSGTGGFTLVAESDVPVPDPLQTFELPPDEALGESASATDRVFPLRLRPGEDASCLNLYQPERPRVVGVTPSFVERGGFRFSAVTQDVDNPWELLGRPLGDNVIPAIGDANSVRWILHSGLGEDIALVDDRGETVYLRLVALLDRSIFQSELVVAEDAFVRHFPEHGGYSYFLFQSPLESREGLARSLEAAHGDYGLDVTDTTDKLARFLGIEEMYLSTFQLLGGLGLILGTVGLGVVLVRNVNERRSELAMLQAFGFGRRAIAAIVVLENAFQLVVGLVIGSLAGFLALSPYFLDASLHPPWHSLVLTLGAVIVVAMLSSVAGVAAALRSPLLPALRAD